MLKSSAASPAPPSTLPWERPKLQLTRVEDHVVKVSRFQPRVGTLTYALTPPRASHPPDKRREVADKQTQRLAGLPLDAVVVYDIQDEAARTNVSRPYPFIERVNAGEYVREDLALLAVPKVVYAGVAQNKLSDIERAARDVHASGGALVLVGAASTTQTVQTPLKVAQRQIRQRLPQLPLGGVVIAERHRDRGAEDERLFKKVTDGCSFFVSQTVYCEDLNKQLLRDTALRWQQDPRSCPVLLFTLSPAGSSRTLEFLQWLGVHVPAPLLRRVVQARDPLQASVQACAEIFYELWAFADRLGLPIGCNVESVAQSQSEVEASLELVHLTARIMGRKALAGEALVGG